MLSQEDFDEPDEPPELDMPLDDDEDDDDDMVLDDNPDEEFIECDPTGRYGRYAEILGKGAMKTVYRAYDMVDCKEVAWNKTKPPIEGPEEQALAVQREVHLLQGLNHKGIIKLYSAWVSDATGDTNFITELCSSTLLAFRLKHKHVSRKAVKSWGRQILKGLVYLHMQNPPIIHRDLKCENIFVKCSSNTALKIGDFGSATLLDETHHMHTLVGTPEFMAPEMFQEDYNELVDVYSFGMCMLELLTRECPYSECKSIAHIYKKVTRGEKPKALHKVKDIQALRLINRCLLPVSKRPSASELLADPFLQCKEANPNSVQVMKVSSSMPNLRNPMTSFGVINMLSDHNVSKVAQPCVATERRINGMSKTDVDPVVVECADLVCRNAVCAKSPSFRRSYCVMGRVEDEHTLHLKIRIQESSQSCDIDFPFDLRYDSPKSVAEEMVRALDYPESDLFMIADLISEEVAAFTSNSEKSLDMHARPVEPKGPILEQCQNDCFDDSLTDTTGSNSRYNHLNLVEFGFIADPVTQQGQNDDSGEWILQMDASEDWQNDEDGAESVADGAPGNIPLHKNCAEFATLSTDGGTGNTALDKTCAEFAGGTRSTVLDKSWDKFANLAVNGGIGSTSLEKNDATLVGDSKTSNTAFVKSCTEVAFLVAGGVTSKESFDKSCATLAADGGTCSITLHVASSESADSTLDGRTGSVRVNKSGPSYGGTNSTSLEKSRAYLHYLWPKSPLKFNQLPAGIGILLQPPPEHGLQRRPLPLYVNARA